MTSLVHLPRLGANDETAKINVWLKNPGDFVKRGDVICAVETTKAVMDITAEDEGFLAPLVPAGASLTVGAPLAALTQKVGEDFSGLLLPSQTSVERKERPWTKKAEILARRLNVDLYELAKIYSGTTIGEAEVLKYDSPDLSPGGEDGTPVSERIERVLILGSAKGGGAALIVDALSRIPGQHAIGILDRDPNLKGKSILTIPILGSTTEAADLWDRRAFDAAVIAFNADLDERAALFEDLMRHGVTFTNVIDTTAAIRLNTRIGTGNVILASCYLGTHARIGDNNFLSSHTCVEHHCRIGSHCAFGPGVTLSGRVNVGSKVRFGTKIGVEPGLDIGDNVIVASGATLTRSIPADSIVKARIEYTIRPREQTEEREKA
jgi:sugar O-acyltransferase (sialic acid O-acetyltransferase NeuD family)